MPGKRSRKFIDKKKDVVHTFKLVQRSQKDPLVADETAPQTVLIDRPDSKDVPEQKQKYGVYFDDDYDYLQHIRGTKEAIDWGNTELEVYTIHRKDPKLGAKKLRKSGLQLPSSVFESYVEEPIGLLNKGAPVTGPQPELDPDVVAGLELSDFEDGDETELPDDFVTLLNSEEPVADLDAPTNINVETDVNIKQWLSGGAGDINEEVSYGSDFSYEEEDGFVVNEEKEPQISDGGSSCGSRFNDSDDEYDDERLDEVGSLQDRQKTFRSEGAKSAFTNYSLSSSNLPRSEHLSLFNDRYEEMFLKKYTDDQIGPLDGEDIDGYVLENSLLFQQALEETKRDLHIDKSGEEEDRVKQWVRKHLCDRRPQKDEMEEICIIEKEEPGEMWDCESILSTYSNIYNHPKCINTQDVCPSKKKLIIDPATGMPARRKGKYLSKKNLDHLNPDGIDGHSAVDDIGELKSLVSAISFRPKGETPEDRRLRKSAVKEYRKARREEKKLNKLCFKEEKQMLMAKMVREASIQHLVRV